MSIRNPALPKHPLDQAEYFAPFDAWLCDGTTIATIVSVASEAPGVLVISNVHLHDAYTVAYTLVGGVAPNDYDVTVTVETSRVLEDQGHEVLTRVFPVRVRD